MSTFSILGTFVDTDVERTTVEDITPQIFKKFISGLGDKQPLDLHINSCGGSVTAGISIANSIRQLSKSGHKVTCTIDGLAASIASVVACACDEIVMPKSSFIMIHNAWSVVQGNSDELRKEADLMDKMNSAIISFYRSKFSKTDEELKAYMDEETWISGSDAADFGLKCTVVEDEGEYKMAACLKNAKFNHIPESLIMKEETKEVVEGVKVETPVEAPAEAPKAEAPVEEKKTTEHIVIEENKDEMIAKAEADKRVAGMQSTMAKQIDALKKEYNDKIEDFQNQLKAKDEELISAKNEITSLVQKLDESAKELSEKTSALIEKEDALAKLNANVNQPTEELPTMEAGLARCKTPAEKVAFLKSGKYTH